MMKKFVMGTCLIALTAFAADQMGTWKLNTAKSKYSVVPMPKELTVTYTPQGNGWRSMAIKGGNADKATAVVKRQGKQAGTATRTISKDGKTMTIDATVTMPDGKQGTYHSVYEKQ